MPFSAYLPPVFIICTDDLKDVSLVERQPRPLARDEAIRSGVIVEIGSDEKLHTDKKSIKYLVGLSSTQYKAPTLFFSYGETISRSC
jgi:hypothetical protein